MLVALTSSWSEPLSPLHMPAGGLPWSAHVWTYPGPHICPTIHILLPFQAQHSLLTLFLLILLAENSLCT